MCWKPCVKFIERREVRKNNLPKVTFPIFQVPTNACISHLCIFPYSVRADLPLARSRSPPVTHPCPRSRDTQGSRSFEALWMSLQTLPQAGLIAKVQGCPHSVRSSDTNCSFPSSLSPLCVFLKSYMSLPCC